MSDMCPHCGVILKVKDGLTPYHDWPKPTRQVCPGSKQNARCAESDKRPLWNGNLNPNIDPFDYGNPYGNGTLVPSDHWGKGCPEDCEVHNG